MYTDSETAYWTLSTIATTTAALLGLIVVAAVFYLDRFFRLFHRDRDSGSLSTSRKVSLGVELSWFVLGLALILLVGINTIEVAVDTIEICPAIESSDPILAADASNLVDETKALFKSVLDVFGLYAFGWIVLGCVNMFLATRRKHGTKT